jgi:hypothetical protein
LVKALAYPAALLLLVTAFYWRLSLTTQYDWMWGPDLALQVLPWYEEEARQFHEGNLPTWEPHGWGGQPLLAQGQPGAAYPLNWLLFLLPRVHGHISTTALRWYYIAIHWMAALFCYLLCRDLRLSRFASLIGGLVFALSSYVGTVAWPQMLNGAVWAPLVFLFLLRTVRGHRPLASAALCGLVGGLSWLSGHHQAPMFISLAAAFTWAWYILQRRPWKLAARLAALALVAFTFMFLIGAMQLVPAQEYGHLAKRWVSAPEPVGWNDAVPYAVHRMFSLSPITIFSMVIPGMGSFTDPFIGVIAFALMAFAVTTAWERSEVKLFTALAIGAFAYALGFHNVFQGILYAVVPRLNMARTPAMAIIVFSLGAAVLAAYGADALGALRESLVTRRTAWILAGFGVIVWMLMFGFLITGNPSGVQDRVALTALFAVAGGVLLFAWHRGSLAASAAAVLLLGMLLIDLGNDAPPLGHRDDSSKMADLQRIRGDDDIAQFLSRQKQPFRVEKEAEEMPDSWSTYHDLDGIKASNASLTINRINTEWWTPGGMSLLGVQFTIGRSSSMPDAKEVFTGRSGFKVFQNPHAFPRAWAVHELVTAPNLAEGQALIRDHLEDMHSKAFTVTEPAPRSRVQPCTSPDTIAVGAYKAEQVSIRAEMACDGMVVLSDTFYPGWKATVDNQPARVYEVNLAMRGVLVPKGVHDIEYRYAPASVYMGALLSAIGIVGASLIAILQRGSST